MSPLTPSRVLFIGGGNMARAIIGGLAARGVGTAGLAVVDPDPRAQELCAGLGVRIVEDGAPVEADVQLVVLAVKPQQLAEVARTLAPRLPMQAPPVLSIAAGVREAALARWLGPQVPVIRAMPNTPALLGAGVSALHAGSDVPEAAVAVAEGLLAAVGTTLRVPVESDLDAVTAISGSGPAYFFLFTEALIEAGRTLGLSEAVAERLAVETLSGAACMVREAGEPAARLRERVTSRGGTTERALEVLAAGGLGQCVVAAAKAACERSREMGERMGEDREA